MPALLTQRIASTQVPAASRERHVNIVRDPSVVMWHPVATRADSHRPRPSLDNEELPLVATCTTLVAPAGTGPVVVQVLDALQVVRAGSAFTAVGVGATPEDVCAAGLGVAAGSDPGFVGELGVTALEAADDAEVPPSLVAVAVKV
jgi:hypothetical protein